MRGRPFQVRASGSDIRQPGLLAGLASLALLANLVSVFPQPAGAQEAAPVPAAGAQEVPAAPPAVAPPAAAVASPPPAAAPAPAARPPLHERIDLAIAAGGQPPLLCSDADFLRRVYLDLVGMVPTAAEARAFLDDPASDKRVKLIDALLADPRFPRRLADVFDSLLMERRADKHVKSAEWEKYLYESFVAGKPLNELCREILVADGVDPAKRAPARFYLDREADPNLLTRDVGRIFFGRDLQCAQCHDHPQISDYYQTDYYGIYAFLQRSYLFEDKQAKISVLAEKAEGEANFQSVFDPTSKGTMPPMLPGGTPMAEPEMLPDEAYLVKPAKDVRPVPKFSRRERLAADATSGQNVPFNKNFANRIWAMMMGRGLVEPVDLHHADNPPTHPALLADLATSLAQMNFDVKSLVRELALSRTYQRELELPADMDARVATAAAELGRLEAEQARLKEALVPLAAKLTEAEKVNKDARAAADAPAEALKKAKEALAAAQKPSDEAAKLLAEARTQVSQKQAVAETLLTAATQTAAAVAKLPEDAELKAAASKFDERARQLTAEVTALQQTAAARETAAQQAAAALATVQGQVAQAQTQLTESSTRAEAARQTYEAALSAVREQKTAVAQVELVALSARVVSQAGSKLAAVGAAQQQIAALTNTLSETKAALEKLTAALPALQTAQAAAEQSATAANAELAAAQQQAEEKRAQLAAVNTALTTAQAAQAKLPDDAELKAATAAVQKSQEQVTALLAAAEQQQAARQQAATAAQAASAEAARQVAVMVEQRTAAEQQQTTGAQGLTAAQAELTKLTVAASTAREELTEHWSQRFVVGTLQPLTADQFAWSLLQVTGLVERQLAGAATELDKKEPLDEAAKADPARVAARRRQVFELAYERLQGNSSQFANLFSPAPGQPQEQFFASVDQALFLTNGNVVQNWIAGGGGGQLLTRLSEGADLPAVAEELYLSVFSRRPSPQEIEEVGKYLAARGADQRPAALQELVWGLITSSEFRFNH